MKRLKTTIKLGLCALGVMASAALAQAAEKCTDCITFSADKAFGIKLVKGKSATTTVNLTYSTDQENWKTFEVNKDYQAAALTRFTSAARAIRRFRQR